MLYLADGLRIYVRHPANAYASLINVPPTRFGLLYLALHHLRLLALHHLWLLALHHLWLLGLALYWLNENIQRYYNNNALTKTT